MAAHPPPTQPPWRKALRVRPVRQGLSRLQGPPPAQQCSKCGKSFSPTFSSTRRCTTGRGPAKARSAPGHVPGNSSRQSHACGRCGVVLADKARLICQWRAPGSDLSEALISPHCASASGSPPCGWGVAGEGRMGLKFALNGLGIESGQQKFWICWTFLKKIRDLICFEGSLIQG